MSTFFERINDNNPWWTIPRLIENDGLLLEFSEQKFRYVHPLVANLPLDKDAVLTVRGPRRVGKSTLIKNLIKRLLLEEKVPKEAVFHFLCDRLHNYDELYDVVKTYLDFARPRTNSRLFLFLDEISFVTDWQRSIKEMVDAGLLKNALVLLTGSSILDLKFGSEWLSGRRGEISPADIFYYPLSFPQFVDLVAPDEFPNREPLTLWHSLPKLNKLLSDFLITGGFPKIINEYFALNRISHDHYETLLSSFGNDLQKTNRSETIGLDLSANLFRTISTPVSYLGLARDTGLVSHLAIREYLDILEKMFILFSLPCLVIEQRKKNARKNKKIYFTDPFIFNTFFLKTNDKFENPFARSADLIKDPHYLPAIAENLVAAHLKRKSSSLFWGKTAKGEVDFVGKKEGIFRFFEVKYQEKIDFSSIPPLANIKVISKKTFAEKPVKTLPLEIFLLSE